MEISFSRAASRHSPNGKVIASALIKKVKKGVGSRASHIHNIIAFARRKQKPFA